MKDRAQRRTSGVTLRAVLIGLILIVANAYWLAVTSEMMEPQCLLTFVSLFFNAVFCLFVLVLFNQLIKSIIPHRSLSTQELLVIYEMVVMLSTIGGHTLMCFLVGTLAHPFWFAGPENEWASLFWRYIPRWFTPPTSVLKDYFEGDSTFYTMKHIRGWLTPVIVWSSFIAVIWFVLICMNVMIRAQWTEKEKLAYPIIRLPLEMTANTGSFLRSPQMWIGFSVASFIELLAGLHHLFPKIPAIRVNYYWIGYLFTEEPWDKIGDVFLSAFPFIIGLTFFMPLDLSLSAWVFYLLGKMERVVRMGMLGTTSIPFDERAAGAWIAVGILALWGTRRHLKSVFLKIFDKSFIDDSNEPMRFRTAAIGMLLGIGFLTLFSYRAGMTLWAVGGFLVVYLIMSLAVTRVRAEFGPPSHEILNLDPARILAVSLGPRRVGAANLTVLSFYYWLNRLNVAHPMPNQLEGFKMAERTGINTRKLAHIMMLATAVGALASFWAYLHLMYKIGANSSMGYVVGVGWEVFGRLQNWLNNPTGPDYEAVRGMGTGFVITSLLYMLRYRFLWWPLHPIGYVMTAATWGGLADYWFSIFIGWFIKMMILKFFGLKAYKRAVPFFLGLILGDYITSSAWSLLGTVTGISVYVLWSP